ncbi:RNA pseudouridylate synthase [Fragilaria crotonensis]|nr:RNA pseudouridylate synthase [Fragilaria crotonensis]
MIVVVKNVNALATARNYCNRMSFISAKGIRVPLLPRIIRVHERSLLFSTSVTNTGTFTTATGSRAYHATSSSLHSHWSSDATSGEESSSCTGSTNNAIVDSPDTDTDPPTDPSGLQDGHVIVDYYATQPNTYFDIDTVFGIEDIERLKLTSENVTLPAALCLLQPEEYPSLSRARKACRKGSILIHRHENHDSVMDDDDTLLPSSEPFQNMNLKYRRGLVGDRVYPGDILCKQIRRSHGSYSEYISDIAKPSFDLPIVYEDDYIAIVNKPPGVLVYDAMNPGDEQKGQQSQNSRRDGAGRNTIKFALPYVITPPPMTLSDRLDRPELCHRLDKPTSGLLIVAKTKRASVSMSRQFEDRQVKKTYTAILNGKLEVPMESSSTSSSIVSSKEAHAMGIDVDPNSTHCWCVAENVLDDKVAITLWRVVQYQSSIKAQNQTLTVVELKPKTGRHHQLRRQMAWMYHCPIVGDTTYGGVLDEREKKRWGRGLFLCATSVAFRHPLSDMRADDSLLHEEQEGEEEEEQGSMVRVSIPVPPKFESFLAAEGKKFNYTQV